MKKGLGVLKLLGAAAIGAAIGGFVCNRLKNKVIKSETDRVKKFKGYYNLLNQWLLLKQDNKSLENYFNSNGYHKIAIYGMGELGNRLYEDLKQTNIKVAYAIDKKPGNTYSELEVYDMDADLEEVDVIVISAIFAFEEINEELSQKVNTPIISLEDIIFGL
ncbi:MAG: hypothetical protein K0S47_791 [Herbinix sp.]|jgi:hypothetical protein|nr:hypothetical protein [Herbinix sp.]